MRIAAKRLKAEDRTALFKHIEPEFLKDFIAFTGTGSSFFRFFREIKKELLTPEELAKHTLYTDFEEQAYILQKLWSLYTEAAAEDGFSDAAQICEEPVHNDFFMRRFDNFIFLISGFLTKHEARTLKRISEDKNVCAFFHFQGEKTKNHTDLEKYLGIEIPKENSQGSPSIEIAETGSKLEEYELIIKKIFETNEKGIEYRRMAVILTDESMKSWFTENDPYNLFNVTSGSDGFSTEIYRTGGIIAKALEEAAGFDGAFLLETAEELACQPFIESLDPEGHLKKRLTEMKANGKLLVKEADISAFPKLRGIIRPFFANLTLTPVQAVYLLKNLSKDFIATKPDKQSAQHSALIKKELNRLSHIFDKINEPLPAHAALEHVLGIISGLSFHKSGGPVTVMGLLETRNMHYDAIFVPAMNADIFPPGSDKDLFLNTELRLSLGLPTFADREQLIKNYMSQIAAKSKFAYFSYISQDKSASARSPFLEEIIIKNRLTVQPRSSSGKVIFNTSGGKRFHEIEAFSPDKLIREKLKKTNLSASKLNDYIVCPFRFYMKHILYVYPPLESMKQIPPAEYGTILHNALNTVYSAALPQDAEKLHEKLESEFISSIERYDAFRLNPVEREQALSIAGRLRAFAESEIQRFADGWKPAASEEKFSMNLCGLKIAGKLDRRDVNGERIAVIDYKLKNLDEFKTFDPEKVKDIQMPLYALLYESASGRLPDEVLWYDMKKTFKPVKAFDHEYIDDFREFLKNLLSRVSSPELFWPKTENSGDCKYCDYQLICGRA
jgi:RecB family exonuclease